MKNSKITIQINCCCQEVGGGGGGESQPPLLGTRLKAISNQ